MKLQICIIAGVFFTWLIPCNGFVPKHSIPQNVYPLHNTENVKSRVQRMNSDLWNNHLKQHTIISSPTSLSMSYDDGDGPAFLTVAGVLLAIVILVGTSIAPTMDMMNGSGSSMDYNLADSVVTRQDAKDKMKDYSNPSDKLSRSKIQEKLNSVPVFYLADSNADMKDTIYLSFKDASDAVASDSDFKVKCTTLDQVTYPLIFKRGRMRMAPPPPEVKKVEDILYEDASKASDYAFKLMPSTVAKKDADSLNLSVKDGDIPLFLADRLAFASNDGPQVPLFLEKDDCVSSYNRLRKAGGNKLPEEPTIRTTTLLDVVNSMEKGTRPAVKQLQFYATAEDLLRATEML